jgi:GTP-binding protein
MDSNDLERERGITILAKVTSLNWKDTRINIVDTPGHADFGGEVERILNMVDGAVLLVDAAEGPMPQTKFVLQKALKIGLKPHRLHQQDRPPGRAPQRGGERGVRPVRQSRRQRGTARFPDHLRFRQAGLDVGFSHGPQENMAPLFDLIVKHFPARGGGRPLPHAGDDDRINPFLGRVLTGRVRSGTIKANQTVKALSRDGKVAEQGRISKVLAFRGLERVPVDEAEAGDIIAIAGLTTATVADTICDPTVTEPIFAQPIDPPTLTMTFRINDGPLAGKEGDKVQSRVIRDRLLREAEGNVALKVTASVNETDAFEVAGRGELQLGILIETMRREGFELTVGRPRVVFRTDEATGEKLEPSRGSDRRRRRGIYRRRRREAVERRAEMRDMRPSGVGRQRIVFHAPTRGLIGYQSELLSDTRGTAIMNRLFHSYAPYFGESRPPYRRAAVEQRWRGGGLCDLQPAGPRPDVHRARHQGLCRHDHRRAHARQ